MVEHGYNSSYVEGGGRRILSLMPAWAKLVRPCVKKKPNKQTKSLRCGSMHKALDSTQSTTKNQKKKKPQTNNKPTSSILHTFLSFPL
jgi:hypothetical protein